MWSDREKNEDMDVEEIAVPKNTLTDEWLSQPRKKKTKGLRESQENSSSSTLITPSVNQIKRLSAVTSSRSILRKTNVAFYNNTNITFLAPNSIQYRHLLAREIISLTPSERLSRWDLSDGKSIMDDNHHLELLRKINFYKDNHHHLHVDHNAKTKQSHEDISYLSLISVLNVMNAGLVCFPEDCGDIFVIIPTGISNASIVHIPLQNENNTMLPTTTAGIHEKNYLNEQINCKVDNCNQRIDLKRKRLFQFEANSDTDCVNNDDKTATIHRDDSARIDWPFLNEKYAESVNTMTLEPVRFVKDVFSKLFIVKLTNVTQSKSSHLLVNGSLSFGEFFQRLRTEGMLMTKAEAAAFLGSFIEAQQKTNFLLIQALLRIQFVALCSQGGEKCSLIFLNDYATHMTRSPNGSKRNSGVYEFTMQDYINEICSIIEMLAFVLTPPHSFASYVTQHVLIPFSTIVPSLISEIADYLELDVDDLDNTSSSKESLEPGKNDRQKNKSVSPATEVATSRWDLIPDIQSERKRSEIQNLKDESSKMDDAPDIFQNKPNLVINHRNNHFLKSKEKYCGGMFSTNFIRQVAVSDSKPIFKKTLDKNVSVKHVNENYAREVMATPDSRRIAQNNGINIGINSLLGRRLVVPEKDQINKKSQVKNADTSSNSHAKLIRAVVAIRKRR